MVQENTNKAITINSIILYAKMGITTICGLLTTRFALQALGIVDFGLYSVLGGIISFIGIFNTIMLTTSNRYIAVAIGKGDEVEANRVFNVNLTIFLGIALTILTICYPIGHWYIYRYVNYDGDINNAMMVFMLSVAGSVISAVGTPYNGLLVAKEKFLVFSLVGILTQIVKLMVSIILVNHFTNKLLIYTITLALMTGLPTIIYWRYCVYRYSNIVRWSFVKDKALYKEILGFSGWVSYGAIACIAKAQGAALLVNAFFNTVMNTALGIANSIYSYVNLFAQNVTQPIAPQITKNYAAGNIDRTVELVVMSTKFSFLLTFLMGVPFFVDCEWILQVWLGEVPPYAVSFTMLLIIDSIVESFNSGISPIIFASGKIVLYQVLINTLRILSIMVAFFALRAGYGPQSLFIAYIVITAIIVITTQWVLRKTIDYDFSILFKRSYIPSIITIVLFLPILFVATSVHPIVRMLYSCGYLCVLYYFIGLSKKERSILLKFVKKFKK